MGVIKKGFLLSGVCFLVPLMSDAQSLYLPEMREAVTKFMASESANTAYLTEFPLRRVSYLQAFATKGNGNFVNYNQSDNVYQVGLTTESYYRFNDRVMLYGKVSYSMHRGQHMTGSSFIPDDEVPFQLVEMADSCAGSKRLETYTLIGGLGYQVSDKVALGGKIAYEAANYAKFKDLRHQNSRMKLEVDLGATYRPLSWLNLGLSYTYHRKNESISFDVYGNTDRQYYTLIDFGGFFGRKEAFGESGYTADSTPLFTQTHGGAFQANVRLGQVNWFNEIFYQTNDGQFGTGDDQDIMFSTHNGHRLGYNGKFLIDRNSHSHVLNVSVAKRHTENYENNYKESTDQNGVSQIFYYGKNQMLDRTKWNGVISYTFFKKQSQSGQTVQSNNVASQDSRLIQNSRSKYELGSRLYFSNTESTTSVFPYYRKQTVNQWQVDLFGTYNWFKNRQVFSVDVILGYGAGGGTMKEDGLYVPISDNQKKPERRDDLLLKEYDYLTASRLCGKLTLGYERNILKNLAGYVKVGFSPRYALNSSLKETSFLQFDLQIGTKF